MREKKEIQKNCVTLLEHKNLLIEVKSSGNVLFIFNVKSLNSFKIAGKKLQTLYYVFHDVF